MSDEKFLRQYKNLKTRNLSKLSPLEEEMEFYTRFFDISIRKFNEEAYSETKKYNANQFYNLNHKIIKLSFTYEIIRIYKNYC